jgi:predicted transcriptional regulator of viral defense system
MGCVLAYHTALEFHGAAYSVFHEIQCFTNKISQEKQINNHQFRFIKYPIALLRKECSTKYTSKFERQGMLIEVTSIERTVVDVLDRTELAGGIEEVWRSLSNIDYFNIDESIDYALHLATKTAIAKLGFFLEENQARLMVSKTQLNLLQAHVPKKPLYWKKNQRNGKLIPRWNIVIPEELVSRSWDEPMEIDA